MTIAEENERLKLDLAKTKDDLAAGDQLQTESAKQVEELNAKIVALTDANTAAEARLVAVNEAHAVELEAERAKVDEIASAKALEIVAQQGAEPADETEARAENKSLEELWAHYATLSGDPKEQTRFYRAEIKPRVKN